MVPSVSTRNNSILFLLSLKLIFDTDLTLPFFLSYPNNINDSSPLFHFRLCLASFRCVLAILSLHPFFIFSLYCSLVLYSPHPCNQSPSPYHSLSLSLSLSLCLSLSLSLPLHLSASKKRQKSFSLQPLFYILSVYGLREV